VRDQDRIEAIFLAAQALEGSERESYLARECANDLELRAQVESLLAAARESEAYFDNLLGGVSAAALSSGAELEGGSKSSDMLAGNEVGPYTMIELLGVGGMGEVWRAQRTDRLIE